MVNTPNWENELEYIADWEVDPLTVVAVFRTGVANPMWHAVWRTGVAEHGYGDFTEDGRDMKGVPRIRNKPKKLTGFVNIYRGDEHGVIHHSRELADANIRQSQKRIACIDLSQFNEGHGL